MYKLILVFLAIFTILFSAGNSFALIYTVDIDHDTDVITDLHYVDNDRWWEGPYLN